MTEKALTFKEVLSVLTKASPYSVATERAQELADGLTQIKEYLYIETEIERDFHDALKALKPGSSTIVFLCGSSGDGKSELLTKYKKKFETIADFHLDATHSFKPQDTAIETLNLCFAKHLADDRPLVIGVNVGMLGNYAQEGEVQQIKDSIAAFLAKQEPPANHIYLDFEQYPKFKLTALGYKAELIPALLERVTRENNNPIYRAYAADCNAVTKRDTASKLLTNYKLLALPQVQKTITDVLFKIRLDKDQFITTRALLDFVHHLLTGPNYLFDNLFALAGNELADKAATFDPAGLRTRATDDFVLASQLQLVDEDFEQFDEQLKAFGFSSTWLKSPASYLRLFYLLKDGEFGNNYHYKFRDVFADSLIEAYRKFWYLNYNYDGSSDNRNQLNDLNKKIIFTAVQKYNNRNTNGLNKDELFIASHNGYQIIAVARLKANFKALTDAQTNDRKIHSVATFTARVQIAETTIELPVSLNLLALLQKIVDGFRPNKYDKSAMVVLADLIHRIKAHANNADTIHIVNREQQRLEVRAVDDEFEVEGL